MALINADDLRTYWKVARNCDNCKYTEKNCVMDYSHSLCDICISIDEIPTVDAIPVEWLREHDLYYTGISGGSPYMNALIKA